MSIFASPDFGAGASFAFLLFLVWLTIAFFVVLGLVRGTRLVHDESGERRRHGVILLVVSGLVPFTCCTGPPIMVRLVYGNFPVWQYPTNKINEGMTKDEVLAALGSPHQRQDNDHSWYYWGDSFGLTYFGIWFGSDGRVEHTFRD